MTEPHSHRTADFALPFLLHNGAARGRLVRVSVAAEEILSRHAYPRQVSRLLAETAALAVTLADALKFDGVFTLQAKGSGPVRQLVADVTSAGMLRACATFDPDAPGLDDAGTDAEVSVQSLLGTGYLAFTVDQGDNTDRYQGIVELTGHTLTECIHEYFRSSEQLETAIKVASRPPQGEDGHWQAGALMVQRMPLHGGTDSPAQDAEEAEDAWRTAVVLLGSLTAAELLNDSLPGPDLLYRLFHQEGLRLATEKTLAFGCRCSRERVEHTLATFTVESLDEMRQDDGTVSVVCQFCSTDYVFTDADLAALPRDATR